MWIRDSVSSRHRAHVRLWADSTCASLCSDPNGAQTENNSCRESRWQQSESKSKVIYLYCTFCQSSVPRGHFDEVDGSLGHSGSYVLLQQSSMIITADRYDLSALEKDLNTLHIHVRTLINTTWHECSTNKKSEVNVSFTFHDSLLYNSQFNIWTISSQQLAHILYYISNFNLYRCMKKAQSFLHL